jgi:hypothetical protein
MALNLPHPGLLLTIAGYFGDHQDCNPVLHRQSPSGTGRSGAGKTGGQHRISLALKPNRTSIVEAGLPTLAQARRECCRFRLILPNLAILFRCGIKPGTLRGSVIHGARGTIEA